MNLYSSMSISSRYLKCIASPVTNMAECNMFNCDVLSDTKGQTSTYVNEALNLESVVDYFLINDLDTVS